MEAEGPMTSVLQWAARAVCAACVCALGAATSLGQLVGYDGSRLPGDMIDSRFVAYTLEHGYLWLTGKVPSFWNAPFYYPMPQTIALSDNMIGALPFYAVLRVLTPTPEQAMVGLVVLFFLLNYAMAVVCLRGFGAGFGASLVAAYPVAFGLLPAAVSLHPQCLQLYPVLLGLLALRRLLLGPSHRSVGLFAAALTFLGLSSFYFFMFFLLLSVLAVLVACAVRLTVPKDLLRALGWNASLYGLLACCLALLAVNYLPYFQMSLETGPWPVSLSRKLAPNLAAFFSPPVGSWAWGWLDPLLQPGPERRVFPGLFPMAGLLVGGWLLWRRPDPSGTVVGVLAVAAVLTCLGFSDGSLLRHVPGFAALRVTTRVGLVALPCCAIGLAFLLERLAGWLSPGRAGASSWPQALVLGCLLGCVAADQYVFPTGYPSFAWSRSAERVAALMGRIPEEARVFYVNPAVPVEDPSFWSVHLDAMLAAQRLGKATYNGYSGWLPPLLAQFFDRKTCAGLDDWRNVAGALYHPGESAAALYDGSVGIDFPACPPDAATLARPQGRHTTSLARPDRLADIQAVATYSAGSRLLGVAAAIRNAGSQPLHGLGDFSHRHAVFLVAEVYDDRGVKTDVPLGRLEQSIAPGGTLSQQVAAALPPGLVPQRVRVVLVQAPAGGFAVTPAESVVVRIEP
jgi:hypothetical protein